jgi:RimJ/RimL family protein N-acetyltransferase
MTVPCLESPRLILRPYKQADFDAFAALNGDAEVRRHVGGPLTRTDAAARFQSCVAHGSDGLEVWAVTLRNIGAYIGHCWLAVRKESRDRELGFIIVRSLWRQGYGTEVCVALLEYAARRRYPRVVATVDVDNNPSIRVLERAGMKRERDQRDEEGVYLVFSCGP